MVELHTARPPSAIAPLTRRPVKVRRIPGARCHACGCWLAFDNGGHMCRPCAERPFYDPRTDGRFALRLAVYLAKSRGRWCDPRAYFGIAPDAQDWLCRNVARLRAAGWVIASAPPRAGYYVCIVGAFPPCHAERRT